MKRLFIPALALLINMLAASPLLARDTVADYSIAEALTLPRATAVTDPVVRFYFGAQGHGTILKNHGVFKSNKKTNAFGKTDKEACQWTFLSAMISLKERAIQEGANAVINIKSNYKNNLTSSTSTFQCGAGAIIAGVALVGTVVTIR